MLTPEAFGNHPQPPQRCSNDDAEMINSNYHPGSVDGTTLHVLHQACHLHNETYGNPLPATKAESLPPVLISAKNQYLDNHSPKSGSTPSGKATNLTRRTLIPPLLCPKPPSFSTTLHHCEPQTTECTACTEACHQPLRVTSTSLIASSLKHTLH